MDQNCSNPLKATSAVASGTNNTPVTIRDRIADADAAPHKMVYQFITEAQKCGKDDPFYILDLDVLVQLYQLWREVFPRVEPFYAVKVNDDPVMLQCLASLGAGFDCASQSEIQRILEMGIHPDRIVYSHPCKHPSHLKYAAKVGVSLTPFDSEDELDKIFQVDKTMRLMLRIQACDPSDPWNQSAKFGCSLLEGMRLLAVALKMGLHVVGVCIHVGRGTDNSGTFVEAIANAKIMFDFAWSELGYKMDLLDIGGGFPGSTELREEFFQLGRAINRSLEEHFPASSNIRIIGEPGRYFAMAPFTLCCSVIAKRIVPDKNNHIMYYLSDGKFGSLSFRPIEGKGRFEILRKNGTVANQNDGVMSTSTVWGPTCNGIDCIMPEILLPEMQIGDWMVFYEMGAYSATIATNFNGFFRSATKYVASSRYLELVTK